MNNELVLLRSPSGYGKSTYAQKHFVSNGYIQLEADQFLYEDGVYVWKAEKLHGAHIACQRACKEALEAGKNVVISNTNCLRKEILDYVRIADALKVPYRVLRLTKEFKSIHNVPENILVKQKSRMTTQVWLGEILVTDYDQSPL